MNHISSWCKTIPSKTTFQWNFANKNKLNWNKTGNAALLTTGGNCPGINYAVHSLIQESSLPVMLFKKGFEGLNDNLLAEYESSSLVQEESLLGLSRDNVNIHKAMYTLQKNNITNLYIIGGKRSASSALFLHKNIVNKKLPICVNVIPKTINNDIPCIEKSFGFDSSVETCTKFINHAFTEAKCNNEISIIKLMGRYSGFLSLYASYAANHYDFLLIPEIVYEHKRLIERIDQHYRQNKNVTIVLAEGYISNEHRYRDYLSILHKECRNISKNPKLFTPNYFCRSSDLCSSDKIYIKQLVKHITYASEEGYGGTCIGTINKKFALINLREIYYNKLSNIDNDSLFIQHKLKGI